VAGLDSHTTKQLTLHQGDFALGRNWLGWSGLRISVHKNLNRIQSTARRQAVNSRGRKN
jgi:hypothetical protein